MHDIRYKPIKLVDYGSGLNYYVPEIHDHRRNLIKTLKNKFSAGKKKVYFKSFFLILVVPSKSVD